jgi:autotransporter-associated beta strand protein
MKQVVLCRSALAAGLALALGACSSGSGGESATIGGSPGGGTPINTPGPGTPPPTTPPPTGGQPGQPAINAHLSIINAEDRQGLSGAGVVIGVVDSGVNRSHPTLSGRVVRSYSYVDPATNNLNIDDVVGHGTTVASLAAGTAVGSWPGGVAPGAQIVSARIISDKAPVDDGTGQGNAVEGALGMAAVHADLIASGVKVMNNSWGGLYWNNPTTTDAIAAEYKSFVFDHGGLVVFATGNEGKADPSDMAALPSQPAPAGSTLAMELAEGWLAVTAVNANNPNVLASYANACGVAAEYCLAAPGEAVYIDPASTTSTNPSYQWGAGTSYAAPLVSGAAALVWEKYPYMKNYDIQRVLLGTATDLGAPGVDAVFGHGLLNVAKALNGPATTDFGWLSPNVPAGIGTSVWSNDISGSNEFSGLRKLGDGILALEGKNTFVGEVDVVSGTLALRDGATLGTKVDVGQAYVILPGVPATLQFGAGTTRITGNVNNESRVALVTANTTAVIDGNYQQHAEAEFITALGASPLQVTGTATLKGGTLVVEQAVAGYVPADNQVQPIIQAAQGLTGQFQRMRRGGTVTLLDASFVYDATSASLNIRRANVSATAATAGLGTIAVASAGRVEQAFVQLDQGDEGDAGFADAAGQLQRVEGASALQASLDSLSGKAHGLATAMTFDALDMSRRALSSRFDDISAAPRLRGAWHSALGEAGQGSFAGTGFQTQGWMLGQDMALGSNGVMGFAFGETRTSSGHAWSGDNGRDRQSQAQLYAGWNHGGAYALGQVGAGQFTREIDRQLLLGAGQYGVNARYGGSFSTASVESGYRFGGAAASLTPYLGADYARVDNDRFSESGGFGFGLRSDGSRAARSQALAGLRAETRLRGWSIRGYAEWQQLLSSDGLAFDASFVGVDAWAPLAGLQPARSGGLMGLSVQSWLSRNSQLSFGYDQRFGPRGDLSQVALRYSAAF